MAIFNNFNAFVNSVRKPSAAPTAKPSVPTAAALAAPPSAPVAPKAPAGPDPNLLFNQGPPGPARPGSDAANAQPGAPQLQPYRPFTTDFGANITGNAPRISQYLAANQEHVPDVIKNATSDFQSGQRNPYSDSEARLDRGLLMTANPADLAGVKSNLSPADQMLISDEGLRLSEGGRIANTDPSGMYHGSPEAMTELNRIRDMSLKESRRKALNDRIDAVRNAIKSGDVGTLDTAVRGAYQTGQTGNYEVQDAAQAAEDARIADIGQKGGADINESRQKSSDADAAYAQSKTISAGIDSQIQHEQQRFDDITAKLPANARAAITDPGVSFPPFYGPIVEEARRHLAQRQQYEAQRAALAKSTGPGR